MLATRLPLDVIDSLPMAAVLTVVRELQPDGGSQPDPGVRSGGDVLVGRSRGLPT